jgi:YgiT-type zinc finger domain-containing protein
MKLEMCPVCGEKDLVRGHGEYSYIREGIIITVKYMKDSCLVCDESFMDEETRVRTEKEWRP